MHESILLVCERHYPEEVDPITGLVGATARTVRSAAEGNSNGSFGGKAGLPCSRTDWLSSSIRKLVDGSFQGGECPPFVGADEPVMTG